ncbi:MAG: serine hydrolase [Sphingobacteriaceae bacterium]|nr:MAG: serine hydrolase [Sphingobacteriaceae bacterium]
MKRVFIFFAFSLLFTTRGWAQATGRSTFLRDSLDIYVNKALTQWRVPGLAICIVKDGRIVLMKGYGTRELGLQERIDENTLFMLGEITEAFTTTAFAKLEANKTLSLNDKITRYLPSFKLDNKASEVTINDLLTHRAGFKTNQGNFTFYNTSLTTQQVIDKIGHIKPVYPFRATYGYTNSAYAVAAEVIPKVTGRPWYIYLKESLFIPLGMNNTLPLSQELPLVLNRTVPHTIVEGRLTPIPYPQLDNLAAGLSISSTMGDMSKWMMALLNNGKVGARQVIPEIAIKTTLHELTGNQPSASTQENEQFGLGWFLQDYAGRNLVMRNGKVSGYSSSITLVPQENLGILIMTNTDKNELPEALRWQILDTYFNFPYHNYSDSYLDRYKANDANEQQVKRRMRDSVFLNPPPAQALVNYTGRYVNDVYGHVNVSVGEGNTLEMRLEHHPKMFVKLQPMGGNRFYATFSEPIYGKSAFTFVYQAGRITSVRIKVSDAVETDAYDFKKID